MASSLLVAFETVTKLNLLPGYSWTYIWKDSKCDTGATLAALSDFKLKEHPINAVIGPACSVGCIPGAYLAAHWDIPMISYACVDTGLSRKESFPTFVRTVGTYARSGKFFLRLMEKYKWSRVAILSSTETVWTQVASFIKAEFDSQSGGFYEVSYFQTFDHEWTTDQKIQDILRLAKEKAHGEIFKGFISVGIEFQLLY